MRAVAALAINGIVGSGIFALPAAVALILGPAAPVAYLACAVLVALALLSIAESGSRVARTGGTYAYVEAAFGSYAGFIAGTFYWLGTEAVANGAIAVIFVDSIAALVPAVGGPIARVAVTVAVFGMLVVVNVRGVKGAARVVELLTAAKLAPLLLVAVAGILALHRQNLAWDHVPTFTELGRASLILFFAFQGGETAVTASGEIRDPARTIPRALALGIVVVTAFYVGLQFAAQGVLGPELATNQGAPIAATAERLFGPTGLVLVASTAALSTFGTLSGGMLTGPRLLLGFGERGLLPPPFKSLHPRFRTPQVAIIVHGIACAGFALSGTFRQLAVLSGIGTLIVYLLSCPATLRLRARNVRTDAPPFVLPGGPTIPLLGTVVAVVFLASATRAEYVAASWVFAGASALYLLRPRRPDPA